MITITDYPAHGRDASVVVGRTTDSPPETEPVWMIRVCGTKQLTFYVRTQFGDWEHALRLVGPESKRLLAEAGEAHEAAQNA